MANSQNKIDEVAAELSAEAAAKVIADKLAEKPATVVAPAPAAKPVPTKPIAAKPVAAKTAAAKPVAATPAPAKLAAKPAKAAAPAKSAVKVERKPTPAAAPIVPAAAPPVAPAAAAPVQADATPAPAVSPKHTIEQLKDKIMETTTNTATDFTAKLRDTAAEMQSRAKAAYEKGTELTSDVTAFHKGNFDAMVEAGKVLAAGMQDLGRTAVEDARAAAETVTADVKAMAAVSSPTELFQLQGEIARRNLDTIVAKTSKNAEVMMKLANDLFAPLSSRASVALERFNKAA